MHNVLQVTKEEIKKNNLEEFEELMNEIAELPQQKREKVRFYVQGFIDAGNWNKNANVKAG